MLDDPSSFLEWAQPCSALDGDELIAIGGSVLFDGKWAGWVLFTDRTTPSHFMKIHRTVARFMHCFAQVNEPLIAHLDPDNPKAMRWAGLLGLETQRTDILLDGRRMLRAENHVH